MNDPLAFAKELIAHGVPVFTAKKMPLGWTGRAEYRFPEDWQFTEPDEKNLEGWKPLYAVCAVTGVQFDVLDIDPRNDGDLYEKVMRSGGIFPPSRGAVATPSGGMHYYINRSGFKKHTPLKGIDLQAGNTIGEGRGFVYIPPTIRKGNQYGLVESIDWKGLNENMHLSESYVRFFKWLTENYKANKTEVRRGNTQGSILLDEDDLDDLIDRVQLIAEKIRSAPVGTRDTTLNRQSFTVGGLISNTGLDEEIAVKALVMATDDWGIYQSEIDSWVIPTIRRSIEQGKLKAIVGGF
jgi:hypothetical protein